MKTKSGLRIGFHVIVEYLYYIVYTVVFGNTMTLI